MECVTGRLMLSEQITVEEANHGKRERYDRYRRHSMPAEREIECKECTEGVDPYEGEKRAAVERDKIEV